MSIWKRIPSASIYVCVLSLLLDTSASLAQLSCITPEVLAGSPVPGLLGSPFCATTWTSPGSNEQEVLVTGGWLRAAGSERVQGVCTWDGTTWSPLGEGIDGIMSLVDWNGTLVAGGFFRRNSPVYSTQWVADSIAAWNGQEWIEVGGGVHDGGTYPAVFAMQPIGSDLLVGGRFTTAGTTPARHLARWDGSQWHEFGGGANSPITEICTFEGDLVVGGSFTEIGGQNIPAVARWNGSSWEPFGSSGAHPRPYSVSAVAEHNGQLFLAGAYTSFGDQAVLRWDGSWHGVSGGNFNGGATLALHGTDLYASFRRVNSTWFGGVYRYNGSSFDRLGLGQSHTASALVSFQGQLHAIGEFTLMTGDVQTMGAARWSGNTWNPLFPHGFVYFNSNSSHTISKLLFDNGALIAGGTFDGVDGQNISSITVWSGSGWESLGGGVSMSMPTVIRSRITDAIRYENDLFVSGRFERAGSVAADSIARWDGSAWHALDTTSFGNPGTYPATELELFNNALIVAGNFDKVSAVTNTQNIAAWDGATWSALGGGLNNTVRDLLLDGNVLIAGGDFTFAGPVSTDHIAQWDGQVWEAIGSGFDGPVYSLEKHNGTLVAGGQFVSSNQTTLQNVAQWNGFGWMPLGVGLGGRVDSLLSHNGLLYALFRSGAETKLGVWDGTTWSIAPEVFSRFPTQAGTAETMVVFENRLFIGGRFFFVDDTPAMFLAEFGCSSTSCYADCDTSGTLNILDFICFGDDFAAGGTYADCDSSGSLNILDFICFGDAFGAGCP